MANQNLNAKINIGGALDSSFGNSINLVRRGFTKVSQEIKDVSTKQKELKKQRAILVREGKSVDALDKEYVELGHRLDSLRTKQKKYENALISSRKVGAAFGRMTGDVGRLMRNTTLAIGGASAAIFGVANSTANLGDTVAKTADKLGISISAFQELRYAAERSGVSTEKFDSSLERFIKRTGEAVQGTGAARKAFEELGLEASALASMSPEEALALVADRLQSVESQAEKTAYAAAIFGREGVGMVNMLKGGSAGLQQLRKDALATGYVLSDKAARDAETFKDKLLDAQLTMSGLKNTIGSALMPVVTDMMVKFKNWTLTNTDAVKNFADRLANGLRDALPMIGNIVKGFASAASTVASVTNKVAGLVGGFDNLGMMIGGAFALKSLWSIWTFSKSIWGLGASMFSLVSGAPAVVSSIKSIGSIGASVASKGMSLFSRSFSVLSNNASNATSILSSYSKVLLKAVVSSGSMAMSGISSLGGTFLSLGKVVLGASKVMFGAIVSVGRALLMNPIGLAIAGIAGAALLIYKYWEPIKKFFGNLWEGVTSIFTDAWDGIKSGFTNTWGFIKKLFNWSPIGMIMNNWGGITSFFGNLWGGVISIVDYAWSGIKTLFNWSPIGLVMNNWSSITGFFGGLWDGVTSTVSSAWNGIKSIFNWSPMGLIMNNFSGITDFFSNIFGKVYDIASGVFDWIGDKFSWVGDAISTISDWLGFGGDDEEEEKQQHARPSQASNDPQINTQKSASEIIANIAPARASTNQTNQTYHSNNTITINTQPGQSTQEIVDEIERRQQERQRGALYDNYAMAY
jgi:phage-related protein